MQPWHAPACRLSKGLIPGFTEALLGMKVGGKRWRESVHVLF